MKRLCALLILLSFLVGPGISAQEKTEKPALPLNKKFFTDFNKIPPVNRDAYWDTKLNTIIIVRGTVVSIGKTPRFKKQYRVVLTDREAERMNMKISYHLYIDNKNTVSMLKVNETMEFSGQIIAYTPTSSRRDGYIIDILFEKGATLVE